MKKSVSDLKSINKYYDPLEWNRNDVDLADAMKIMSKKEKSSENTSLAKVKSPAKKNSIVKITQNFYK